VVARSKRLEVKIPAGAKDGTRVRLAGEGSGGAGGGARGDLHVVVSVRKHPRFERRGDDLVTEVGVPVEEAVLGGEAEVETISGKRIALKIAPLTQNLRSMRLSGLGMPKLDGKTKGHGDLIAKVLVVLPEKLSEREKELFEELKEERSKAKAKVKA
jgi:DnaJ-class molecular chaperone